MELKYDDVKTVWDGLSNLLGLAELGHRHNFEYEVVRETLMQVLPLYRGQVTKSESMLEVIQFFTVLSCMTFAAQMNSQIDYLHTWIEAGDIVPKHLYSPVDTQLDFEIEARNRLYDQVDHYQNMVEKAIKNLQLALDDISCEMNYIRSRLRLMIYLLQDLSLLLAEFKAEKGNEQSSLSSLSKCV